MNRKVTAVALACMILLSLTVWGCGTKTGGEDTIKIGWYGPLTGPQAVWGTAELNGAKMAAEEINDAGGVLGKKIEIIGYDTKAESQEAVNAVKRLVGQDKVVAILGPNSSGSAIAANPILEEYKIPAVATVATNPKVTVLDGKVNPFHFRVCFIDPYQGAVAAGFSYDVLQGKTAAIMYDVSSEGSEGIVEFFEAAFIKKGGTIVAKEVFRGGDVDFRPQLSKIKEANPDVIFLPVAYKEVALCTTQARDLGITVPFMGTDLWPSEDLLTMAGAAVEGCYFVNHMDLDDPSVAEYREKYEEKYGIPAEVNIFLVHDALHMVVDAIKRAGVADPVKIAEALETTDIPGLTGRIVINKDTHDPEGKEAAIIKIENGKFVFTQRYSPEDVQ